MERDAGTDKDTSTHNTQMFFAPVPMHIHGEQRDRRLDDSN